MTPEVTTPRGISASEDRRRFTVTVDWQKGDYVVWSAVAGALVPKSGLEQATGDSTVWMHFMVYASVSF